MGVLSRSVLVAVFSVLAAVIGSFVWATLAFHPLPAPTAARIAAEPARWLIVDKPLPAALRRFDFSSITAQRGLFFFVHGYGDHSQRHGELYDVVAHLGFGVHTLDLRGHGVTGGPQVDDIEIHVSDVQTYIRTVLALYPKNDTPPFVVCGSSMGALIAARVVAKFERTAQPAAGVILLSPALSIAHPLNSPLAHAALSQLLSVFPALRVPTFVRVSQLTAIEAMQQDFLDDPYTASYKHIGVRFALSLLNMTARIVAHAPKAHTPLLIIHGAVDELAPLSGSVDYAESYNRSTSRILVRLPPARHELLHDVLAGATLEMVIKWLNTAIIDQVPVRLLADDSDTLASDPSALVDLTLEGLAANEVEEQEAERHGTASVA